MRFNLLEEAWIPITNGKSGLTHIPPWKITDIPADSTLAYNRPDYTGAMVQFLIGLLQTLFAPEKESSWRKVYQSPPSPDELRERFFTAKDAFNLVGAGPRFMQDPKLEQDPTEALPISNLLIDSPGENTLKENKAFFNKGSGSHGFSYAEAAIALFCMQTNAPAGGQGHRTSLRGGGPLTTLIWSGKSLWENLWLNVLPAKEIFHEAFQIEPDAITNRFPWMGKVRTSEANGGGPTYPEDGHPAQYFWGMPRRIWLLENPQTDQRTSGSPVTVSAYKTKNYGVQYTGPWRHPLSPYRLKDSEAFCIHPQPSGIGYRHWMGLVVPGTSGKDSILPAQVIRHGRDERRAPGIQSRLWAFGYDMDNMKARCWYEGMIPLFEYDDAIRVDFEAKSQAMVQVAESIARNTRGAVQKAWFNERQEVRGDLNHVQALFWTRTESDFYSRLNEINVLLAAKTDPLPALEGWHRQLNRASLEIFDQYALSSPLEYENPGRIALARKGLGFWNNDVKIKGMLGIPVAVKAVQKSKAKGGTK